MYKNFLISAMYSMMICRLRIFVWDVWILELNLPRAGLSSLKRPFKLEKIAKYHWNLLE